MNFAIVLNMVLATGSYILDTPSGVGFHLGMAIMGQLILIERGQNEKR